MIINGIEVREPDNYTPQPEIVLANKMTNGNGVEIADYIRTRMVFALRWDYMPLDVISDLLSILNPAQHPTFGVTYKAMGGTTETGIFRVHVPLRGERIDTLKDGTIVWGNVSLSLREV